MATIPLGNFGQTVANAAPSGSLRVPQGSPIGASMERAGGIADAVVTDIQGEQRKKDELVNRAQAALALAQASNAVHDAHDQVSARVLDGSLDPTKAREEFRGLAQKASAPYLSGWMPEQRLQMDAHLAQVGGTLERSIGAAVEKKGREDVASTIDAFGEQVQREVPRLGPAAASSKFAGMVDFSAPLAGIPPDKATKLKQSFTERAHADFYQSAGVAALTKGDDRALGELVAQVQGPGGDAMDPKQRTAITHQLWGWQQSIIAKRERDANREADAQRAAYNDAVDAYNKATDIALSGGYLSPDVITDLTQKAAGTDLQKPVTDLIASQQTVAGFASRPADQRAALIERWRSARATPGVGTDPTTDKLLKAMTEMDSRLRHAADENPWAAAQQAGVVQNAQQFNAADPASAIAVIQQRMRDIGVVESWAGKKISPLQPQEIEQVGKLVRSLPVEQSASMLAQFGDSLGDADRVAALAKQLHDKDSTLGEAMMYANSKTTAGRYTAELVLRGEQALRDNTAVVDKAKDTGWRASIAKQIRGAFSNREVEDAAIDSAFKIMAANYAKDGSTDVDRAVRLAAGEIVARNGQKVPLPYGMKEADFDHKLAAITPDEIRPQAPQGQVFAGTTAIPLPTFIASLPSATLVHAGQGVYNVRAGSLIVTNERGQRIALKVTP